MTQQKTGALVSAMVVAIGLFGTAGPSAAQDAPSYAYPPAPMGPTAWNGGGMPWGNGWGGNGWGGNPWNGGGWNNAPWNGGGWNNAPWSGGPWSGGPWNSGGWGGMPWNQNGGGPWNGGWMNPSDPRGTMTRGWDEMMNTPSNMGTMPGGWRAPSISVPNPVDVGDQFGNAAQQIPQQMGNFR